MRSFSVVLAIVALTCGFAAGQSLLVSQGQIVQFSGPVNTVIGDAVPGSTSGEVFGGGGGPDNGVIADNGKVFFRAQILQNTGAVYPAASGQLARGLFYGDTRGSLVRVAVGGDPEPSGTIAGAVLNTSFNSAAVGSGYRISAGGQLFFGANIWGGAVTTADDTVLYTGFPGSLQILAREGGAAPGCPGTTYTQNFMGIGQQGSCINAAGQVLFQSSLSAPAVAADNAAWFTGTLGNVQLMMRKGGTLPGGDGATVNGLGFVSQMNSAGWVVFDPTLVLGSGTPAVTAADNQCLWLYQPGLGVTQLMREGQPTPIANTTYNIAGNSWFVGTGASCFNNSGQIIINADISGAGATVGVDDRAVIKLSPAGQSVVMRRNDPAPGVPGAFWNTVNNASMGFNDSGTICFQCNMTGAVTTADDTGIWIGTPGNWTLVCREGQVAPGTGGQTFGNIGGQSMIMNGAGQILFNNNLSGGFSSLWSYDPVLGLQAVQLNNDSIQVTPSLAHTAFTAGGVQFTNGDARPLSFANDGTATYRVGFNESSSAIMNVRVGSLTGVPGKISDLTGGAHVLYLNAGLAHAGQVYAIAGSASGTFPGTPIGAYVVPLNIDSYTDLTLQLANTGPFVNTFSVLDAQGRATAAIVVPPGVPGLTGAVVHHAYGVLDAFNQLVFASEAARLEIIL